MAGRFRQHINPLKISSLYPRKEPLPFPPADVLVEVELGCGNAEFLIERAILLPNQFFIGLDIRDIFVAEGKVRIQTEGLKNIILEETNLIVDAPTLFPAERIMRFYINFPDPWFKARHQNRRWFSPETLDPLVKALHPQGEIFFQSDVWDITLDAFGTLEAHPQLFNAAGEWTFTKSNPYGVSSQREKGCQEEQMPVWRMLFHKRRPEMMGR